MAHALIWAAGGSGFTFFMTALGAAAVFLFQNRVNPHLYRLLLGFAAGVMIAASMWSLLIPAIEAAEAAGGPGWLPAAGGCALGVLFFTAVNALLPRLTPALFRSGGGRVRSGALLVLAIALHNIPEGMAVGLSFAVAAQHADGASLTAAAALALGMGIQNFPEGAAVSLPLRQEGMSARKAFVMGSLSGVVELIFGVLVVLVAGGIQPLMPWMLSFAAGAMLYVVVEELVPEAHLGEHSHSGTISTLCGFLVMMILDVALG